MTYIANKDFDGILKGTRFFSDDCGYKYKSPPINNKITILLRKYIDSNKEHLDLEGHKINVYI